MTTIVKSMCFCGGMSVVLALSAYAQTENPLKNLPQDQILAILCAGNAENASRIQNGYGAVISHFDADPDQRLQQAVGVRDDAVRYFQGRAEAPLNLTNAEIAEQHANSTVQEFFIAFDERKFRFDRPDLGPFVKDEEKTTQLGRKASATASARFLYSPNRSDADPLHPDPRLWGTTWSGRSLRQVLQGAWTVQGIRFERFGNDELPVIQLHAANGNHGVALTIDNYRGCLFRRIECRDDGAAKPSQVIETEPRRFGDVWFFGQHVIRDFAAIPRDLDSTLTYTAAGDFMVNPGVPASMFALAGLGAKPGDMVIDRRTRPPMIMTYGEPPLDEAALRRQLPKAAALAKFLNRP